MEEGSRGLAVWNGILGAALKIPGARLDRASFLRTALLPCSSPAIVEAAIRETPAKAGVRREVVSRVAKEAIKWHLVRVSATSAVAGMPGGWWVAGTVPLDMAQYFWHVLVVLQKVAYLHGWPSLMQDDDEIDDETRLVLTLFVGVMLGAHGATTAVSKLAGALGTEVASKLPRAPLTRLSLSRVAREVAKWIGLKLTKKKLGEILGRAMPIAGGVIAGTMTWMAFGAGAERLHQHLETLSLARE